MRVVQYVVRGDSLIVNFDGQLDTGNKISIYVDNEFFFPEPALEALFEEWDEGITVAFNVKMLPSTFRHNYVLVYDGGYTEIEGAEKLVPLFFDKDLFHKSRYTWIENRHYDAETNAFISSRLARTLPGAVSVTCSMAVVYAYKSLEVQSHDMCLDALAILEEKLSNTDLLFDAYTVREDRWHLVCSMLYSKFLLHVFLCDWKGLTKTIKSIWINIENWKLNPILRTSSINIIKPLSLIAYVAHRREKLRARDSVIKKCFDVYVMGTLCFTADVGPLTLAKQFAESKQQFEDLSNLLFLQNSLSNEKFVHEQLQYHAGCTALSDLEANILTSCFRTFGDVNNKMKDNIERNLLDIDVDWITDASDINLDFLRDVVCPHGYPNDFFNSLRDVDKINLSEDVLIKRLSKSLHDSGSIILSAFFSNFETYSNTIKTAIRNCLVNVNKQDVFSLFWSLANCFERHGEKILSTEAYLVCGRLKPYNSSVTSKLKNLKGI